MGFFFLFESENQETNALENWLKVKLVDYTKPLKKRAQHITRDCHHPGHTLKPKQSTYSMHRLSCRNQTDCKIRTK